MPHQGPILLLFLSIALGPLTSAISLPASIPLTSAEIAIGNVTLNANLPDPRFSITPAFGTSPLPIEACLMNVLYFMTEIAYGDFTGHPPAKTYRVPDYNTVEIVTGTTMVARFLMWAIWLAMDYMMSYNRFTNVLFTLRWKERILGTIAIQPSAPRPPTLPTSSSSSNIHHQLSPPSPTNNNAPSNPNLNNTTIIPPTNDATIPSPLLSARFALSIDDFPDGKSVPLYEFFMTCYTGLLHCAQLPTTVPMQPFGNRSPIGDTLLHMFTYGPGLQYVYVIRTLAYIPRYLLRQQGGLREVNFDLLLDGVLCARGAITKGRT